MFTEDSLERMKYAIKCNFDWENYQIQQAKEECEDICNLMNLSIPEMRKILDQYGY